MAPRHPQPLRRGRGSCWRAAACASSRRSQSRQPAALRHRKREILLLDTLGELLDFYAAADVAFVGGSLVPIGGHNLLEPAALGMPILTGPNNSNSADVARAAHRARRRRDRARRRRSSADR